MNSITEFLDLEDANIIVEDISTSERTKTITISTVPIPKFCPQCLNRMHSRGIKKRKITILEMNYHEACEEIQALNEQIGRLAKENEYLYSFVHYKELSDVYLW